MTIAIVGQHTEIGRLIQEIGARRLPGLVNGIRAASNYVLAEWTKGVLDSSAKKGWKQRYADSIKEEPTQNPLESTLSTDDKYAHFIEDGVRRFDMKPGLLKGKKVAHVPFRHFIPGTNQRTQMSKVVYDRVKKLKYGKRITGEEWHNIGRYSRVISVRGHLQKKDMAETKSGMYEGLIKENTQGHTEYKTFRTVSRKSVGWIYPGSPAVKVFSKITRKVGPRVKEIITEGLMYDLDSGLRYGLSRIKK